MKYAIIADIHAQLGALQAVLRDAEQQGCTHTVCLGDIVGYWDKPKECVDIIRAMGIPCVKGNCDEYCSSDTNLEGFNPRTAEVIRWTREQLTEDQRDWLRNLPLVEIVAEFTIVHATLDVILHKLYWDRITPSDRQRHDAAGVAAVQRGRLDEICLRRWALDLGISASLEDMLSGRIRPKTT